MFPLFISSFSHILKFRFGCNFIKDWWCKIFMVRETNKPAHASSLEHSKLIILIHAVNDSANYASVTFIPLSGLWFPSVCGQNKKRWKILWHFLHVKQLNFVSPCPDVAFAYFGFLTRRWCWPADATPWYCSLIYEEKKQSSKKKENVVEGNYNFRATSNNRHSISWHISLFKLSTCLLLISYMLI